jgi:hypothetical protein
MGVDPWEAVEMSVTQAVKGSPLAGTTLALP